MKKLFVLFVAFWAASKAFAVESPDSCFVYGYLHWSPTATKYVAKLELGPGKDLEDIIDENGSKLKFASFLNALNYLVSKQWEVVEISPRNPDHNTFVLEQFAIIRRKMALKDAKIYISPKN
ncbi:MAG: hypothetical protein J5995_02830 [Muribaculaceae bacterium]|nr:hypothetical protein [Muribaculaceae bacterium]